MKKQVETREQNKLEREVMKMIVIVKMDLQWKWSRCGVGEGPVVKTPDSSTAESSRDQSSSRSVHCARCSLCAVAVALPSDCNSVDSDSPCGPSEVQHSTVHFTFLL